MSTNISRFHPSYCEVQLRRIREGGPKISLTNDTSAKVTQGRQQWLCCPFNFAVDHFGLRAVGPFCSANNKTSHRCFDLPVCNAGQCLVRAESSSANRKWRVGHV